MGAEIRERPENTEDLATLRNLKVTENGTIGQIIHDLLLVELFDVKYYRDVEMWVRGHSMSLKLVPFEIFIPHLYLSPSQGVIDPVGIL